MQTDSSENAWLQNGYKNFKDAIKSLEYVEFVDEIRIFDAVFHEKSRSSSELQSCCMRGFEISLYNILHRKEPERSSSQQWQDGSFTD